MSRVPDAIDVSDVPDLLRLAEEVHETGKSRVLRRADTDLAIIEPILEHMPDVESLIARLHRNLEARKHNRAGDVDTLRLVRRDRMRRSRHLASL